MPKPIYIFLGLIFTILTSCEEPVNWELDVSEESELVIEAILTDEFKQHQIRVTKSFPQLNEQPEAITDATVFILFQNNAIEFNLVDSNSGIYESEIAFSPATSSLGSTYVLQVSWEGNVYEAAAQLAPVKPIPPINIGTRLTGQRYISRVAESYSADEQAMYKINLDWSSVDPEATLPKAQLSFYTFNTIDISGLFNQGVETINFPNGTQLIEKKFGLSDAYADYLRGILVQTNWQGGAFDETENNISSNFTNDAKGFFAICSVLSDTLIVE